MQSVWHLGNSGIGAFGAFGHSIRHPQHRKPMYNRYSVPVSFKASWCSVLFSTSYPHFAFFDICCYFCDFVHLCIFLFLRFVHLCICACCTPQMVLVRAPVSAAHGSQLWSRTVDLRPADRDLPTTHSQYLLRVLFGTSALQFALAFGIWHLAFVHLCIWHLAFGIVIWHYWRWL